MMFSDIIHAIVEFIVAMIVGVARPIWFLLMDVWKAVIGMATRTAIGSANRSANQIRNPVTNAAACVTEAPVQGTRNNAVELSSVTTVPRDPVLDHVALGVVQVAVCDEIRRRLEQHQMLNWPEPKLFYLCSEVSNTLKRKFDEGGNDGISVKVVKGFWTGVVTQRFIEWAVAKYKIGVIEEAEQAAKQYGRTGLLFKHNWIEVTHAGRSLMIDPTYVQFDDSEPWSFGACIEAARENCLKTGYWDPIADFLERQRTFSV